MTNAQIHADNAVKEKLQKVAEPTEQKKEFKLKRFQDVNPRTSTKRTGGGYASMNNVLQKEEPYYYNLRVNFFVLLYEITVTQCYWWPNLHALNLKRMYSL